MENFDNIQIADIERCYQPEIWDGCDKSTNLSDETLGYYAWVLQNAAMAIDPDRVYDLLKQKEVLCEFLHPINCTLFDAEIRHKTTYANFGAKKRLETIEKMTETELLTEFCVKSVDDIKGHIENLKRAATNPCVLHNFELSFKALIWGIGYPVVLRNGYLLKCLRDAKIDNFEELDDYHAVLIYNPAKINAHICAFVKFDKNV